MPAVTTPRPPVLNLPNLLTASRFVLAFVLFVLIEHEEWLWGTGVFVLAAFTDWLDGYLARRQNLISTLGRNLDPLVDKVLMCGAFVFLLPFGPDATGLNAWIVSIVISRELLVTSLRSFLENSGATFGADWAGKIKMALQCAALIAILLVRSWQAVEWLGWTWVLRDSLVYAMTAATVLSGLQYLWKAALLLRADE
jgi:CDP-diacylglycerol--glycerol-3-phosphate 3-phosphatidyltransferase